MRVVYHSFYGRYSDSPRAIFESLRDRSDLSQVWLADPNHQGAFPADVTTVRVHGAEARDALESADLLVANTHTETEWRKGPHTTYLQTWHGTPLKRVHRDVLWAPPGRLSRLDRDVAKWDLLLSPNAASTPRLRHAFRYDREVLESGYPRNDVLNAPERDALRQRVRRALGVDDGTVAVLYTPTWRDDEFFTDDRRSAPLGLDFRRCIDGLGAGYRILARSHALMTGRSVPPEERGVVDVSYYPDIAELYLAADVLVTDYSSAMFDFAVTGKPIVYYTYDMERYRSSIRGFYFDLFSDAPGPVVATVDDLVGALRDIPGGVPRYAAAYERFVATYCHLEDGSATSRVLGRLGLLAPVATA
ncbi:MAG: CDP-glycerol glycerophosphotransferase family protein [Nocardioidaceae bacterium]